MTGRESETEWTVSLEAVGDRLRIQATSLESGWRLLPQIRTEFAEDIPTKPILNHRCFRSFCVAYNTISQTNCNYCFDCMRARDGPGALNHVTYRI